MQTTIRPAGRKRKKANHRYFLLIVLALLIVSGCAARGARRVPADRFNYNAAIAQSTREQMLLNIVRGRYLEVPVFLIVSSVLTQYEYDSSIGVGGSFGFGGDSTNVIGGNNGRDHRGCEPAVFRAPDHYVPAGRRARIFGASAFRHSG